MYYLVKKYFALALVLILFNQGVWGQITQIKGKITDASTNEVMPFANVSFKGSTVGTTSDINGYYFIETKRPGDSLVISTLGYEPQMVKIQKNKSQVIDVQLHPQSIEIDAVVITPGENPAHILLRNIWAHRERNSPKRYNSYNCEIYSKIQVDISNVSDKLKEKKLMQQFDFVFKNTDSSELTGKKYIPILLSETLSDYYYQKEPKNEKEIIKASQISGTKNQSVTQFTGKLYQEFDVYDNFLTVFEDGFVSPLSEFGLLYYRYYITDSATIGDDWCYKVEYKPKRKQERTFSGEFWVADTSFSIKKINLRMAKDANINFINDFYASLEYDKENDSIWHLSKDEMFVDFNLSEKITGLYARKTTVYNKYNFNLPIKDEIKELPTEITVADGAINKDKEYWDKSRPVELNSREQNVYAIVDSVKNMPIYRTVYNWTSLLVNYYYTIGYFEWGPYFSTYSFNELEGNRFRVGGRTSNKFSTKIMYDGYLAYGTDDEKLKYGGGFLYMFNKNPRITLSASYKDDVIQLGQSPNAFHPDNILASILRRNPNNKLTYVKDFKTAFEKEWFQGLSNTVSIEHKRIMPTHIIGFFNPTTLQPINNVIASEVSLNTRYAYNEKYLMGEFERVTLGTPYPILNLTATWGMKNVLSSQYDYLRLTFTANQKVSLSPFGYMKYQLEAGKIFGRVPYPLLELHKGNETYAFDYYAFNMMNYYEFASDQYVQLFIEQHFQGLLLNHVPLFRKLKLREVASVKGVIGTLDSKNKELLNFSGFANNRTNIYDVREPYFEASVGIENIFKIIRIDAMWRLNYLNPTTHPDIQQFGLRAMLQVTF
jgi:hypothetical protein